MRKGEWVGTSVVCGRDYKYKQLVLLRIRERGGEAGKSNGQAIQSMNVLWAICPVLGTADMVGLDSKGLAAMRKPMSLGFLIRLVGSHGWF